jgi:hypothetical protein
MTKLSHTAQDCIDTFKDLATKGPVTRDLYRKESGIPESVWEYHFGTFAELKRAAGATPTLAVTRVANAVAKHTAAARFEPLNKERQDFGDKYLRTDPGRYKTIVVASDLHDKEIDPFYLRVFLDTVKRVNPDVVSLGGDVFDLPEFGRYTIDPREWDAVGRIKFAHENIFKPLREAAPDAQIDLIEGNHECVSTDTQILTDHGWIFAESVVGGMYKVASFDLATQHITFNKPVATAIDTNRDLYRVETTYKDEIITDNHSMIYDGKRVPLIDLLEEGMDGSKFANAIMDKVEQPIHMDENIVQFACWLMTHGVIRTTEGPFKYWVSFKVNKRMERRIKAVVQSISGVKWIKTAKGVEVEGPALASILETITGLESIPDVTRYTYVPNWFKNLTIGYGQIVAREMTWGSTQAFMSAHTSYYNGYNHKMGEDLQWFFVTRGIPCSMRYLPLNQYILTFNEEGGVERWRGKSVNVSKRGNGKVISIQTKDGTLITRRGGKINFTGNCRLVKHLADFSPATRALLSDLHGMTIGDLFGLPKFQINYVAKADLKSFTDRDHKKELENNYRIYYDTFMVHHFPHARHMGVPGVNGHHHSHVVWPMYNVHMGEYEWHQLGAGHKRKASYCEGERWHNGFAIVHIDTLTKTANIEYIPITSFAVVGGKMYVREPSEIIT